MQRFQLLTEYGWGEIERHTVLMEIRDFANAADTVEGRRVLDDRCNPVEEVHVFTPKYFVHRDGEYADGDIYVNTCESHASQTWQWLSPDREASKDKLTPYLRIFCLRPDLKNQMMKHSNMLSTPLSEHLKTVSYPRDRCK
jgi:hypothetical protein